MSTAARFPGRLLLYTLLVFSLSGCEFFGVDEDFQPTTKKTSPAKKLPSKTNGKKATPPPPPPPAEKLIELDVGKGKLRFADCYVTVVPATSDRPAVLQITSYENPKTESFPSVFIRSVVPADDIKAFLGQPLSAKIYMTRKDKGPVWHTPDDAPANIVIQNADDSGRVVGSIISAVVLNSDSPEELAIKGRFDGALQ